MNDQLSLTWQSWSSSYENSIRNISTGVDFRREDQEGWLRPWPAWMKIRRKHAARCKNLFCHHDFNSHFRYLGKTG